MKLISPEVFQKPDNILAIKGPVHFDTVMDVLNAGLSLMQTMPSIHVDLKDLEQSDSSVFALCAEWMRAAKTLKKELFFINPPPFIQEMVQIYDLNLILPCLVKAS